MSRQYRLSLNKNEISLLKEVASSGTTHKAGRYARALLLLDKGEYAEYRWTISKVSEDIGVSDRTLSHIKEKFLTSGLEAALGRDRRSKQTRPTKFGCGIENAVLKLASTKPPQGHRKWTLRLLAGKAVEEGIVDDISHMTVWRILKNHNNGSI
ncbi:MAG: helix-turn-helix domain-containing protein [Desulfovibrionaceae bacterium]|nr:helix-turn-helix domain-containing protein [Desulfovibrionaceae bacterium]